MKKSDLIEIAIKVLGLYLCLRAIETLTKSIQQIINYYSISDFLLAHSDSAKSIFTISNLLDFFVLGSFAVLFTFGSKIVTRKICNKSDYSDNAQLFTDNKTFIEIAIVIIGGLLLVNSIPDFLFGLYSYVDNVQTDRLYDKFTSSFVTLAFIKIVIGALLLYFNKGLSNLLTKKKDNLPDD